jgi:hypothetical protein
MKIYTHPNWFQRMWQRVFPPKIQLKEDPRTAGIPEDVARDLARMITFDIEKRRIDCPKNMTKRLLQAGVAYWEANEGIEYTFNKHKSI